MKKGRVIGITIAAAALLALAVTAAVFWPQLVNLFTGRDNTPEPTFISFQSWWENADILKHVPAMQVEKSKVNKPRDCGGDYCLVDVDGTSMDDYRNYLMLLEACGFVKYSDNGQDGLEGYLYNTNYTKGDLTLTVTHAVKTEKTYIIVGQEKPFSDHLRYDDAFLSGNREGAQTVLHVPELYTNGSSFVIQLKNGHFILNDGGNKEDLLPLLDYLESLTPAGEKPYVEAWFVSHAHEDHTGVLSAFLTDLSNIDRIVVEAFYFTELSNKTCQVIAGSSLMTNFLIDYHNVRNAEGLTPALYRPETGQRYYFSDICVDICFAPDIVEANNFNKGVFNESSIWLTYTIEGQQFFVAGDAAYMSQMAVMDIYDPAYFDMEIGVSFHHGINVYDFFLDYCNYKTLIYSNYCIGSLYQTGYSAMLKENEALRAKMKEVIAWGDGTKVLRFPYEIGAVETMPLIDWTKYVAERTLGKWGRAENFKTYLRNP